MGLSIGSQYAEFGTLDYDGFYPEGLDLTPDTELHDFIVAQIKARKHASQSNITNKEAIWKEVEDTQQVFIPLDDEEQQVKKDDSRAPVSIVVPYSVAILDTWMSYLTEVFIKANPMFKYSSTDKTDRFANIAMEMVVGHNAYKNKVGLAMYTFLRDGLVYGKGHASPHWKKTIGLDIQAFSKDDNLPPESLAVETVLYEGNALANIDPRRAYTDINVPSDKINDGEYAGWSVDNNLMDLLTEEQADPNLFNVGYLHGRTEFNTPSEPHNRTSNNYQSYMSGTALGDIAHPIETTWMYIKLIPNNWHLGPVTTPMQWLFGLANDKVLISARPVMFKHNQFPMVTCAPVFDGYSTNPTSKLEQLHGLQQLANWKVNTMVTNERKTMNDMLIYDPSVINEIDLTDPEPGKAIRLKMSAWGTGKIGDYIHQLNISDVTANNLNHAAQINDIMQRLSAASDPAQGVPRQHGERVTKAEFQGTQGGSVGRMGNMAWLMGEQGVRDIGEQFAANVTQFNTSERVIQIAGPYQQELRKIHGDIPSIKISPNDLNSNYDSMVNDGSVNGGEFVQDWIQLYQIAAQNPEVTGSIDNTRLFLHIAKLMKANDIQDFLKQDQPPVDVQIRPDEEVRQQVQEGNLVALGGGNGNL